MRKTCIRAFKLLCLLQGVLTCWCGFCMCDSLCTGKGDWKVCCTGAVGGITGWAMGGNCGVGRRPKPGICPLGGSGTFGEEKT